MLVADNCGGGQPSSARPVRLWDPDACLPGRLPGKACRVALGGPRGGQFPHKLPALYNLNHLLRHYLFPHKPLWLGGEA